MADIRIPVARDMDIDQFSGGTITSFSSYMQNVMIEKYGSDTGERYVVTQRPGIDVIEDASSTVSDVKGRGNFYWETSGAEYFVNDDTIYKNGYATVIGTITAGTQRVYFHEIGGKMVIIDPQNDEGWTVTTSGTLTQITDADFPSTIAGPSADLDGYLFIIDNDGIISHCDLDDATSWTATNFVEAERKPDMGIGLAKHHDHIVAFGTSTIEFFYNASNPTGAVISRRNDISYNIGATFADGIWADGDDLFFVGRTERGDYGVWQVNKFQLKPISSSYINTFLTSTYAIQGFYPLLTVFSGRGHIFTMLTLYYLDDYIVPVYSFVHDSVSGMWGPWESALTELSGLSGLPVVGWTESTASRYGSGILTNGDLIGFRSTVDPVDTNSARFYLENETDYIDIDYFAPFGSGNSSNIDLICQLGHIDQNTSKNKFGYKLELVSDYTPNTQNMTIEWGDTDHTTFTSSRTIDTSKRNILSRIGKYNRRTYKLSYSGSDVIRIEGIDLTVEGGTV